MQKCHSHKLLYKVWKHHREIKRKIISQIVNENEIHHTISRENHHEIKQSSSLKKYPNEYQNKIKLP